MQMQQLFLSQGKELFGEEPPPEREMMAVFLAGQIKKIYKQHDINPPPILLENAIGTTADKKFPNIDTSVTLCEGESLRAIGDISHKVLCQRASRQNL